MINLGQFDQINRMITLSVIPLNWPLEKGALIKLRLRLAVADLYQLLLTGGCCSEVAIKAGLTVI